MNKNVKRIISIMLSLFMLSSLTSVFCVPSFAAGSETPDDVRDAAKPDLQGCYAVVPELATESTASLSFNGTQMTFKKGENAAESFAKLYELTGNKAADVILPSEPAKYSGDIEIYAPWRVFGSGFETPPYTAAETPAENAEFTAPSFTNVVIKNTVGGGSVEIYGVTVTGTVTDTERRAAKDAPLSLKLQNVKLAHSSGAAAAFNLSAQDYSDAFTVKDCFYSSPAGKAFLFEKDSTVAPNLEIDGLRFPQNVHSLGVIKSKASADTPHYTVKNCYTGGMSASTVTADMPYFALFEGGAGKGTLEIADNTVLGTSYYEASYNSLQPYGAGVYQVCYRNFDEINVTGNTFIDPIDYDYPVFVWKDGDYSYTAGAQGVGDVLTFKNNRVIGYMPSANTTDDVDLSENYFATSNFSDYKTKARGDIPADSDADFYIDYGMTTKRSDMAPKSSTVLKGLTYLPQSDTLYGYATESFTDFEFGADFEIYSDYDYVAYSCKTPAQGYTFKAGEAARYFVKSNVNGFSRVFTLYVMGVNDAADIDAPAAVEGIDDASVYYPTLYGAANGVEAVAYYGGKPYKFTVGHNVATSKAGMLFVSGSVIIPDSIATAEALGEVKLPKDVKLYSASFEPTVTKGKLTIAAVGDSITDGYDAGEASATNQSTRWENCYAGLFGTAMSEYFEVVNCGSNGATVTSTVEAGITTNSKGSDYQYRKHNPSAYSRSISSKPDIVTIALGTNDIANISTNNRWTDNNRFIDSYMGLVGDYAALEKQPYIIVLTQIANDYTKPRDFVSINANAKYVEKYIAEKLGAICIDMHKETLEKFYSAGKPDQSKTSPQSPNAWFYDDDQHPSNAGHAFIAERLADAFKVEMENPHVTSWVFNNDATCTENGTETEVCTHCGLTLATREKAESALGHIKDGGVYTEPTYEADGYWEYHCTRCGELVEKVIDEGTKLVQKQPVRFPDVAEGKWYKEYVDYVSANGLMNGNADGTFNPDGKLTRAEFVQILANLAGVDTTDRNVATEFADVPAGKWFSPAVKWAVDNKIVNGISPTEFKPNANIERQQICTMVVRYANDFAKVELPKTADKITFADEASIGNYAKDAVAICQQAEIVNGMGDNKFEPKKDAERSQAAKIISVFHQILNK